MLDKITPLILTYNEERNISRTLGRIGWAERIVVVDSGSTDATRRIAESYPQVQIYERAFDDHTSQWNYGLDQVATDWVLTLDADYLLSADFVEELKSAVLRPDVDGYYAPFQYCIGGRPLRGALYPPRLCLFRKALGRYVHDGHTQLLDFTGATETLRTAIFHDDRKPLSHWLRAQSRYADLEVEKLKSGSGAQLGFRDRLRLRSWIVPPLTPLYCLFVKGLILDGRAGLYYTLQRTYAELLLALKLIGREIETEESPDPSKSAKRSRG